MVFPSRPYLLVQETPLNSDSTVAPYPATRFVLLGLSTLGGSPQTHLGQTYAKTHLLADKWLGRAQISLAASEAPGHRVQSSLKGNHFAGHALFGQLFLFLFVHTWHHNPGILAVPELEFQKCKKSIEIDPCVCQEGGGGGGGGFHRRAAQGMLSVGWGGVGGRAGRRMPLCSL